MKYARLAMLQAAGLLVAACAWGATHSVSADKWDQTNRDGSAYFSVSDEGYVVVSFSQVYGRPNPAASTVVADSSEGSVFTGDYAAVGVKCVRFRMRSEFTVQKTAGVMLVLKGNESGRLWRNEKVTVSTEGGQWVVNAIDFKRSAGWTRDGGGNKDDMWAEDIADVAMIGVRFDQNGTEAKAYSIDAFELLDVDGVVAGASGLVPERVLDFFRQTYGITDASQITDAMKNKDTDGDGMSDWDETWAGTDPNDANSVFAAELVDDPDVAGVTIQWPCVTGGRYTLLRCTSLLDGFSPYVAGLTPTPAQAQAGIMAYTDSTATGTGPYFYKLLKE